MILHQSDLQPKNLSERTSTRFDSMNLSQAHVQVATPLAVGPFQMTNDGWFYELAPLLALPEVDLSVSVKSRYIRNRHVHRLIRRVASSPLTFVGYIVHLCIGIAVFYLPARLGQILSIVGVLIGLPGALISLGNLRFELVAVLLQTYDVWFFGAVSTAVSVVLGIMLHDVRAILTVLSWLSFSTNICVDASLVGLRQIWLANIVSVVCYMAMAGAVSIAFTDGLEPFNLIRVNGHQLPAGAVVRDGLITMMIVVARNIVRKYSNAVNEKNTATGSIRFRCVSFRCRLQLRAATDTSSQHDELARKISTEPSTSAEDTSVPSKTKLCFDSALALIDVRNTLIPMRWLWRRNDHAIGSSHYLLPWIGAVGFVITNAVYLVNVVWLENEQQQIHLPVIILGASASTIFVGVTMAAMQRQLLRAIATSFDFLFILVEISIVHFMLADILGWRPVIVIALASELLWCVWILCWDAITLPARRRLGLSRRHAASIGSSLAFVLAVVLVIIFLVKPRDSIRDRVLFRFHVFTQPVELRALTWYFSCAATISSWAIRIMWRLWMASDTELVVLDGTVVYENHAPARSREKKAKKHHVVQAVSRESSPETTLSAGLAVVPVG